MKLIHLSDLHFGCERKDVVASLLEALEPLAPDLVVVSGDLTQRARPSQFRAARLFLSQLSVPWLAVPGNHDLPLYNVVSRFFTPFRGYRQFIHPKTNVGWIGQGAAVYGFNTTGRLRWKFGRVRRRDMKCACEFFSNAPKEFHKILVVHHPSVRFAQLDADLVLCGHMHKSSSRVTSVQGRTRDMIVVAAGTAISQRERDESNSFNEMILNDRELSLRVHSWDRLQFHAGEWLNIPYHSRSPVGAGAVSRVPSFGASTSLGLSIETGPRSM